MSRELQRLIDAAPEGGVVEVPAGRHGGLLVVRRALTLRGAGADLSVLDPAGASLALAVDAKRARVRLEGLCLMRGAGSMGGAVTVYNDADLELADCVLQANRARGGRGGAIGLDGGSLLLERCVFTDNQASLGGALYVGHAARALVRDSRFARNQAKRGGVLLVDQRAQVTFERVSFEDNRAEDGGSVLFAYGAPGRRPSVRLRASPLPADGVALDPVYPGDVATEP